MRNGIFPVFTKGRVLKRESLEYLRDFPYDLAAIAFEEYADGVLCGFSVSYEEGCIFISPGVLKYQNKIIVVSGSTVTLGKYGQLMYIKAVFGEDQKTEDFIICPVEIEIDINEPIPENEMELGRFCLENGAELRCRYDSFGDLRTAENTLDLTHVPYGGHGSPTLHPIVMKEYARTVLGSSTDSSDTAFALMCLNSPVVNKVAIQWHIAKKNNAEYEDCSLSSLYDKLFGTLFQCLPTNKMKMPRGRGPSIY